MKTLNLEVEIENDEDLIQHLDEVMKEKGISFDKFLEELNENKIKKLTEEEFEICLEEAANAPRISFEEFQRKLNARTD